MECMAKKVASVLSLLLGVPYRMLAGIHRQDAAKIDADILERALHC